MLTVVKTSRRQDDDSANGPWFRDEAPPLRIHAVGGWLMEQNTRIQSMIAAYTGAAIASSPTTVPSASPWPRSPAECGRETTSLFRTTR
jgi:hypothetical protein